MTYRITAILMTLSDLHVHSPVASFFKCYFSHSRAAVDKISADIVRRAVPLQQLRFLYPVVQYVQFS